MAVKKVKTEEVKKEVVEVETPVVTEDTTVEVDETPVEVVEEVESVEEVEVEETQEVVEVETTATDDVVVDTESAKVNESNKPSGKVKIRMRVDHKCCIAMVRYDLVAGKTYTVPENVKSILSKAGLLAPL